jgi:hypothetical protein
MNVLRIYVCTCINEYIYIHVHTSKYIRMYVLTYLVYMYECTYVSIYAFIGVCTYVCLMCTCIMYVGGCTRRATLFGT